MLKQATAPHVANEVLENKKTNNKKVKALAIVRRNAENQHQWIKINLQASELWNFSVGSTTRVGETFAAILRNSVMKDVAFTDTIYNIIFYKLYMV